MSYPAVDTLNRRVDEALRQYVGPDGPGFAFLVMDGDKTVFKERYGCARIADPNHGIEKREITDDTVFDLASMSKQFTATGILMLIDQTTKQRYRPLSLETKLYEFFPNIDKADQITIRMLLSHSSGLPDYFTIKPYTDKYERELGQIGFWYASMEGKDSYLKNNDVIRLIEGRELDFDPGADMQYSNTGYVVLAEIIRRITDKSLKQFLKDEIFDRLGMSDTFVYDETVKSFYEHALCYRIRANGKFASIESDTDFNYIHGDGNVHSTIEDMMKWQLACNRIDDLEQLCGTDDGPLIKKSTFLDVFEPLIQKRRILRYTPKPSGYAAGFFIYRYDNANVNDFALYHGGDWLGFHSYVARTQVQFSREGIAPQDSKRISIVVLSNNELLSPERPESVWTLLKETTEIFWRSWRYPDRYNVLTYIDQLSSRATSQ